jgi:membrane protein implicated in regulation of membrane protease activity
MDFILTVVLLAATALAGGLLVFGGPDRVAVAGTLLGSLLTAMFLERLRLRSEDAHRFEQDRRAAYVRLLEAAGEAEKVIRERNLQAYVKRERPELPVEIPETR